MQAGHWVTYGSHGTAGWCLLTHKTFSQPSGGGGSTEEKYPNNKELYFFPESLR